MPIQMQRQLQGPMCSTVLSTLTGQFFITGDHVLHVVVELLHGGSLSMNSSSLSLFWLSCSSSAVDKSNSSGNERARGWENVGITWAGDVCPLVHASCPKTQHRRTEATNKTPPALNTRCHCQTGTFTWHTTHASFLSFTNFSFTVSK
jgi:hypothetical protein